MGSNSVTGVEDMGQIRLSAQESIFIWCVRGVIAVVAIETAASWWARHGALLSVGIVTKWICQELARGWSVR